MTMNKFSLFPKQLVASVTYKEWKFGPNGMKGLKILHIFLAVLFLGGILSSFSLNANLNLSNYNDVYMTYKSLNIISDNIVKIGAQGTILLGVVYGLFTQWGFIKHKWLAVKWGLFIAQTFIGILVVDKLMVANLVLLETGNAATLSNPVFIQNHYIRQYVVVAQIAFTIFALFVSVIKPWRNKRKILEVKPV